MWIEAAPTRLRKILLILALTLFGKSAPAGETAIAKIPDRHGLAVIFGNTYLPNTDISMALLSGFALYDYDRVWPHRAPEPLRFKVEGSVGAAFKGRSHLVASAGMLALYYLDPVAGGRLVPYGEAGIGIIYTGFRIEGQGLRVNFNPQIGLGTEIRVGSGPPWFVAFRLHHLSNAGLHRDNRGVNSALLVAGRFF